ncbi:MAG: hypothetical protein LBB76_02600, partial [Azoarcus sp.]|nr:hypothetical protein [Azoarcus sp.]
MVKLLFAGIALFLAWASAPLWYATMMGASLAAIIVLFSCALNSDNYHSQGIAGAAAILALLAFGLGFVPILALLLPLLS